MQGELSAARSTIEQLGKQVSLLQRDQEVRGAEGTRGCAW